ncbi:MAG: DNA repair protein RadC [Coriobacteriia bacterium]
MAPRLGGLARSPRELLLCGRADALSDAGLLSVLVGEDGDEAGRAILEAHPLPDGLWRACAEDLQRCARVGPARAARVIAGIELGRRVSAWPKSVRPLVSSPEDVVRLCGPQLRGLDREHFWALALNTKNQLLRAFEVSVGSLNASIVHPRELYKEAVRVSAASLVVVHNHPSGDPTPSGADIQLTRRLVKAGDVLGIELLDHVVVGDGETHASLRELGVM